MPIEFVSGGDLTLRDSLEYVDCGSRSPHPGWENNMTTFLAQLGVPTILFWEIRAGSSGYRVTHLNGMRWWSHDDQACGPWAQFAPELIDTEMVSQFSIRYATPYQVHMALARIAFPGVVQSSAEFYLDHRDLVEVVLSVIAESNYAGSFAKLVKSNGRIISAREALSSHVRFDADGRTVLKGDLATGYLRLLEIVRQAELDPSFNPLDTQEWGVLPDARIMSVLDAAIFALTADTDAVYAWSGVAMFQYILRAPDSERWREVTSAMYDIVRTVLPELPQTLRFVLIPTKGLENLLVVDGRVAARLNQHLTQLQVPPQYDKRRVREELILATQEMEPAVAIEFLCGQAHAKVHLRIQQEYDKGNVIAACGITATAIHQSWLQDSRTDRDAAKEALAGALLDEEDRFRLHHQPVVTPWHACQGQRVHLLAGMMDVPTRKLEAERIRFQQMAKKRLQKRSRPRQGHALAWAEGGFSRMGWP